MSFNAMNLSVLAYANSFTLWHYTTTDDNPYLNGCFNEASNMLRKGDMIICNFNTGATNPQTKLLIVTGGVGDTISLTNLTT